MSFFNELKRRNVFRVSIAYLVLSWVLLQVVDVLVPLLGIPDWAAKFVFVLLLVGFPIAMFFAWAFELTPEGIKKQKDVDRDASITHQTAKKLDIVVIVLLVVAIGVAFYLRTPQPVTPTEIVAVDTAQDAQTIIDQQSVAVLPFANRGADQESGFFAEGIHDDLLTQLAKIAGLKVISRTSVMEYRDTTKNMKQIGDELGVAHILEGGIQKSGTRVRINAQLIDAETDAHLWAETFDRELTTENIFEIQSEIALAITNAMQMQLAPETANTIAKAPTENVEAYQDYLAGMKLFYDPNGTELDVDNARDLFQLAVDKDPEFALAWAMLAHTHESIFFRSRDEPEILKKAEDALAKANALQPDLPEVHLVRGYIHYHGYFEYEKALQEFAIAEQGMPGDVRVLLARGYVYRRMDRMPEALAVWQRALSMDPRNLDVVAEVGYALVRMRRFNEAREFFQRASAQFPEEWSLRGAPADIDNSQYGRYEGTLENLLRPDAPNFPIKPLFLSYLYWITGAPEKALPYFEQYSGGPQSFRTFFFTDEEIKGWIHQGMGNTEEAHALFNAALEKMQHEVAERPEEANRRLALARVYAFLGRMDEAREHAAQSRELVDFQESAVDYQAYRENYGHLLCMLGDFDAAEAEFRWLLKQTNDETLLSLVNIWPPCKEVFENTEHYARLKKEFGHYSSGEGTR